MAAKDNTDSVVKILVLGDTAVGKTSIIKRYVHGDFSMEHEPTVGVEFSVKTLTVQDVTVQVQLWDIVGQERATNVSRAFAKGALGAIIVYDISRPQTFGSIVKWKAELDTKVTLPGEHPLPVVLLGNKTDLEVAEVDVDYVERFMVKNGFVACDDLQKKDLLLGHPSLNNMDMKESQL